MDIKEIFDRTILRSGQYLIRRPNLEMDEDSFRLLVDDALQIYTKAVPLHKAYSINMQSQRSFLFTDNFDSEIGRKPDWISQCFPLRSEGSVFGYNALNTTSFTNGQRNSELVDPIQAPWDYNKQNSTLTVPYSAYWKVTAVYNHKIEKIKVDNKDVYTIKTIDSSDQLFLKLVQAYFLQGIGRSRRAFTLNDLPIVMDAGEIASEGKALEDEVTELLKNTQKFYLAFGG